MFLMSSQVKKSGQCQLRDKKHQYFSIVSLPTDSVIVDHAVVPSAGKIWNTYILQAVTFFPWNYALTNVF
jgi:hypothetical protein